MCFDRQSHPTNLSNSSNFTAGAVVKATPNIWERATDAYMASSLLGKSTIRIKSMSPNKAYPDVSFPLFSSIKLTASEVRLALMFWTEFWE
jgi:hypothetical protein